MLEHTIQWARDYFEGIFVEASIQTENYLRNPKGLINSILYNF